MTANSFESHPTTVGWQSDQQKEWQTAAGVKYNERTVQNRLLGQSFNNQLRFAKDPKDWPFTDVWNVQLRPGEAYKLPTVKLIGGSRFFIIRHIHNHTSIISSEMQVELKKNTAFTWGKWGEKNNPQTMLLGEYSVRTGKTPQQHKSTYTT